MQKKKKIIFLIIGLMCVTGVLSFVFFSEGIRFGNYNQENLGGITLPLSENPDNTNKVGYEMIDSETLHFWNEIDDYYLNMSSGMQWSNHYNESFTHNIFCAGYKTSEWNYLCTDDLPIQLNVYSDNLTYVQINGTRVIQIAGRNVGMGINYRLENNDLELNITTGLKLISGENISTDLAFAWRVNDIKINNNYENDRIFVNDTWYDLSDDLDLMFKNMTKRVESFNVTTNQTYYEYFPIPYYKLQDNAYVKLRWNPNLNYFLQVKNSSQYNSPVTLAIVFTGLNVGQTKQTSFYWRDPAPTIDLIYPADDLTGLSSYINFTANLNTTTDIYNFSLWTNTTGTWHLNQTKYPELPYNQKVDTYNHLNMTGNILLFPMDNKSAYGENNTHFYDFSGSGRNGTGINFNNDEIVNDHFHKVVDLEGSDNNYIDAGSASLGLTDEITISVWANTESDSVPGRLVSKHGGPHGFLLARNSGTDAIEWRISRTGSDWNGGTTSANSFEINTWYHIVALYNSTHMRVFINGVEDTGGNFPVGLTGNIQDTNVLMIGRDGGTGDVYSFDGKIDEVAIWNRSLSDSEIQYLYNVTKDYHANFSVSGISDGTYIWNVEGTDNESASAFAPANFTFTVGEAVSDNSPLVILSTPANATSSSTTDYNFTCNVTDDFNIANTTIYVWHDNGTLFNSTINSSTGTSLNYSFEIPTLIVDTYYWNCLSYDNASQTDWGDDNFTLIVTAIDTCTCPGAGNNWEIDMGDYCNITEACDLTTGNITFTNTGWINCSAQLDVLNFGNLINNQIFWIFNSSCEVNIG